MLSRYQTLNPLRLSRGRIGSNPWFRSFHSAIARFTTIDPNGIPVSRETEIRVGEPDQSYVYVSPEVGNAIKSAILRQLGSGVACYPDRLPLQFNHNSHHFAHSKCCPEFDKLHLY